MDIWVLKANHPMVDETWRVVASRKRERRHTASTRPSTGNVGGVRAGFSGRCGKGCPSDKLFGQSQCWLAYTVGERRLSLGANFTFSTVRVFGGPRPAPLARSALRSWRPESNDVRSDRPHLIGPR